MQPDGRIFLKIVFLGASILLTGRVSTADSLHVTASNQVNVKPTEITAPFRNPGMGWLTYVFDPIKNPGVAQDTPLASAVYTNYLTWADMEPVEGTFNWTPIDNLVTAWSNSGKQIKIGIHVVDPTSINRPHVPDWYICTADSGIGNCGDSDRGTWYRSFFGIPIVSSGTSSYKPYGTPGVDYRPNFENPYFQTCFGKFIQALAKHYKATPAWQNNLESIDISTFGYWGEWHDTDYKWSSTAARQSSLHSMIDQYFSSFAGTAIGYTMNVVGGSVSPSLNLVDSDVNGVLYALGRGAAPVRRCIGMCQHAWNLTQAYDERDTILKAILSAGFQGEWGSGDGTIINFYGQPGPNAMAVGNTESAINEALGLGASYLGWYRSVDWVPITQCPAYASSDDCRVNSQGTLIRVLKQPVSTSNGSESLESYFQRRAGYRFYLPNIWYPAVITRSTSKTPQSVQLLTQWVNRGVAKCYKHYRLRAYLVSSSGSETPMDDTSNPSAQSTFAPEKWPLGPEMGTSQTAYGVIANFQVPVGLAAGNYTLKFAVVDSQGNPSMNLAISGKDDPDVNKYSKYSLGSISIQ